MQQRLSAILAELKAHAPFTLFGAATGILAMFVFAKASTQVSLRLFQVFHPAHVVLSAVVTASLFKLHEKKPNFLWVLLVGYFGAIGVATLSDCILPYFGEDILGVAVPTHASLHEGTEPPEQATIHEHEHEHEAHAHEGKSHVHLGFIEEWYLVNPAAILGILLAWFWPNTNSPTPVIS
jgi:hypothetical protein